MKLERVLEFKNGHCGKAYRIIAPSGLSNGGCKALFFDWHGDKVLTHFSDWEYANKICNEHAIAHGLLKYVPTRERLINE